MPTANPAPAPAKRKPITVGELVDALQAYDRALTVSANREYQVTGVGEVEAGELDLECSWQL